MEAANENTKQEILKKKDALSRFNRKIKTRKIEFCPLLQRKYLTLKSTDYTLSLYTK